MHVNLCKEGKRKTFRVNRLVAQAFMPNPNNLPEVNHKDENKLNNKVENLEWCTSEYNNNYGTRSKKISKAMINGKLSKPVYQYDENYNLVHEYPSTAECGRNGFNQGNVTACCRGKRKTHKGFYWSYTKLNL